MLLRRNFLQLGQHSENVRPLRRLDIASDLSLLIFASAGILLGLMVCVLGIFCVRRHRSHRERQQKKQEELELPPPQPEGEVEATQVMEALHVEVTANEEMILV